MKWINILAIFLLALAFVSPALAEDSADQENNPWYWYKKAVDLAYEGKFTEAYDANERALALNATMPVALANKAGILVQLQRYDEAIVTADTLFAQNSTDYPNAYGAAWYSKGDALSALGRLTEAEEAYANAYALDSSLNPAATPQIIPIITPEPLMTQSPVPVSLVLAALGIAGCVLVVGRRK